MTHPQLKPQEVPFDDPRSNCFFRPGPTKPFVATPEALKLYDEQTIIGCLFQLQDLAKEHDGIDYLQVFIDSSKSEHLWFIEDGDGGAITVLLPSEY